MMMMIMIAVFMSFAPFHQVYPFNSSKKRSSAVVFHGGGVRVYVKVGMNGWCHLISIIG